MPWDPTVAAGPQSVSSATASGECFLVGVERRHRDDRAEGLVPCHGHGGGDVVDDGARDEPAAGVLVQFWPASRNAAWARSAATI
jgi:hypothetical protein